MIIAFFAGHALGVELKTFAGGERNVRIRPDFPISLEHDISTIGGLTVHAHMDSPHDPIDLLLFVDAFNRMGRGTGHKVEKTLYLPYIPYARQDRVMVNGEALSSALFGKLINLCGFDEVIVCDPHSDVAPSHIKNVRIYEQHELALKILGEGFFKDSVIVAPDAGAVKKVTKLAQIVGHETVGVGAKQRNLVTNEITNTTYSGPSVEGKRAIMIDDLIDGGRTFIELGRVLKKLGASEVILYATHGIFSYGADVFEGSVDEVYSAYPWMKNLYCANEKNIFKSVDTMVAFN